MGKGVLFCFVLVVLLLSNMFLVFATGEDCNGIIFEDYTMDEDRTCNGYGPMITNGATLDCNGHTISGSGSSGAFYVYGGAEVKNCYIENFEYAVYIEDTNDVIVSNVLVSNSDYGVYVLNSDGASIEESSFSANDYGVYINQSTNVEIDTTIFIDNEFAVYDFFSNYSSLDSNLFQEGSDYPITLFGSDHPSVISNVGNNTNGGIAVLSSNNGEYLNNEFIGGSNSENVGLFLFDYIWGLVSNNIVTDNIFYNFPTGTAYASNVGEGNIFTSNYFCGSSDFDFDCSYFGNLDNTGFGNFMDTAVYCEAPDSNDCDIQLDTEGEIYTLENNMACASDGIDVLADSITIDCAGYTISGDGSSGLYGINVQGDDLTIKNCIIDGFDVGVQVSAPVFNPAWTVNIENSQIENSATYGIGAYTTELNILGSYFYGNSNGDIYTYTTTSITHTIDSSVMCDSTNSVVCSSNPPTYLDITNSYLDVGSLSLGSYSGCHSYGEELNNVCGDEPEGMTSIVKDGFPTEFENTYTCIEADACSDSQDNDADGLIDCADSDCNLKSCSSTYGYACIEGACIEVVLEEAQQATVQIETAYIGYLWSYTDIFSWLNSATVYHEVGVCDDICVSYSQTCLFANAGRSLCSDEDSEKCTCV